MRTSWTTSQSNSANNSTIADITITIDDDNNNNVATASTNDSNTAATKAARAVKAAAAATVRRTTAERVATATMVEEGCQQTIWRDGRERS